ncbi:MAG: iron chelate uptake ABC transporter family permease subunit [Bryobacteraceae bacterium]
MGSANRASPRRFWGAVLISAAVAAAALCLTPLIGSTTIDYSRAWAGLSPDHEILFDARLPRVLLALLAGGALGVAGVLFQALLRDALATPYTLGVSSGASLGAVVAICLGWRQAGHLPAIWVAAFTGAALVLLLVLAIASEGRRMSSFTLLLAGISINAICLAAILFLQYLASFGQTFAIVRWLMGGIDKLNQAITGQESPGPFTVLGNLIRLSASQVDKEGIGSGEERLVGIVAVNAQSQLAGRARWRHRDGSQSSGGRRGRCPVLGDSAKQRQYQSSHRQRWKVSSFHFFSPGAGANCRITSRDCNLPVGS